MKATNITIELLVEEMNKTLDFYRNVLNFEINTRVPEKEPFFAILKNNTVELMLYMREQFAEEIPDFKNQEMGGTVVLYMRVKNIKKEFERLKSKVKIIQELHSTDYGTQEFSFYDCNGYILLFHE